MPSGKDLPLWKGDFQGEICHYAGHPIRYPRREWARWIGEPYSNLAPCKERRPMALTKDKLITLLENHLGMGRKESRQIAERLLKIMKHTLSQGEDLLISGFGKFSVRQKRARPGRNPQTKEGLILSARKVMVFKASGVLRKRINEGFESPD
jgi:integration host factor subunit alpha